MSAGYPAGAGQALDVASTTAKASLGDHFGFKTSAGKVKAVYVRNTSGGSLSKGTGVAGAPGEPYAIGTANLTTAYSDKAYTGCLAATLADDSYGWCIQEGSLTACALAATYDSSDAARWLSVNSAGFYATIVPNAGSVTTGMAGMDRIVGQLRITATTVSSIAAGAATGHIVDLFPK